MQVYLIRHGQSVSNAGGITRSPEGTPLTELGHHEATQIPDQVAPEPTFIVTSPFVRALDTARPTYDRFPSVRRATWPVQEFTYLNPEHYAGTTNDDRRAPAQAYWARLDPDYVDGEGAESYRAFMARARAMLRSLEAENEACIWVFTHGHFMRAVRWQVVQAEPPSTSEDMANWSAFSKENYVFNGGVLSMRLSSEGWHVGAFTRPASP